MDVLLSLLPAASKTVCDTSVPAAVVSAERTSAAGQETTPDKLSSQEYETVTS